MAQTVLMFRVEIGFNADKGYGAVLLDVQNQRHKGIKGNSIRQLMRRVSQQVAEEDQKRRRFPLETEQAATRMIITPSDAGYPGI